MIGNYVGAIRNWVAMQADHDALFMLADLHAITVPQEPARLSERTRELLGLYIACGVDPERSTVFLQSHVPAHTQLLWVLNSVAAMGELQRMTQFKDKAGGDPGKRLVGLFDYPVLMAADMLLYRAERVPVGDDQTQHLELARELARRFNRRYGAVFTIPERVTPPVGARLMSLQDPTAKMSKSDPDPAGSIGLLDRPEEVRAKIRAAVTDSGREIRTGPDKPAITNLIVLYALTAGLRPGDVEARYVGKGYAEFKRDLADAVAAFLEPIQRRYAAIAADPGWLGDVLMTGARAARERAGHVLRRVYDAVGFLPEPHPDNRRNIMSERSNESFTGSSAEDEPGPTASDLQDDDDCCCCCCCDAEEDCTLEG